MMKTKKKLLIFHPTIAPYRIDYFNDLNEAFETRICLQYENLKSQKFDYINISNQFNFSPIYLPEGSKLELIKAIKNQIQTFNPEIIITCEFNIITLITLLCRILYRKKFKIIVMCDDSYDMVAGGNDFSYRHKIARNYLSHLIDEIIVVDSRVEQWYHDKYHIGHFFPIIRNEERATRLFEQSVYLKEKTINSYGLSGKNVFLFVGRLVKLKNLHSLIKAFSFFNQDENVLVIVGAGPEENTLKQMSEEGNLNIIFTGHLEGNQLYNWYNIAKCFVLPSYQEAFGAVTNEALLAGCYVVVSEKAGSSCLVDEGKNGFIFNPDNNDELTKKMKKVIELPEVKLLESGIRENLMRISYMTAIQKLITKINCI